MKKIKIIFLDVDGVLCPYPKRQTSWIGNKNYKLAPSCCRNLFDILVATNARLILSSSWRLFPENIMDLYMQLAPYGIDNSLFIGQTPNFQQSFVNKTHCQLRCHEIRECIKKYGIVNYIVIDDFELGCIDPTRFIQTNRYKGLTKKLASSCIGKLNESF